VDDVVALSAWVVLLASAVPEVPTSSTATIGFVPPRLRYAPVLVPPTLTTTTTRQVGVRIRVDLDGEVERVTLTQSGGEPFDEVVLHGAANFSFFPGRYNGAPVPVDIQYNQSFPPQLPRVTTSTRAPTGLLAGELVERGTRRPLAFATVLITAGQEQQSTSSDEAGRFELELPAGEVRVQILATGNRAFVQRETLAPNQRLEVRYLVDPERRHPYEVVVTDRVERTEIAQTILRGPELKQVPGTFGDPFRVVGTLPGVSSMMSLLPFPIVRGSSPGNTGFLIDGVRVPLLFHLLAGPSIIHPELIDSIEFAPGAFGVDYGGYTGGIVDGKTRPARPDERRVDLDVNLFQAGGLIREPLPSLGGTVTVAGRYGFPGLILSLASPRVSLQYFDYQARYDHGDAKNGYSVFVFGAYDALDSVPTGLPDDAPKEPLLSFQFHRLDLQYRHKADRLSGQYLLSLGYDGSLSQEEATLDSLSATPRLRWSLGLLEELEFRFGVDGLFRKATFTTGVEGAGEVADLLGLDGEPSNALYSLGGLAEFVWRPNSDLVVRPGVRVDGFYDGLTGQVGVDPRLSARYRLWDDEQTVWVKAGVGLYHQPPRFAIPVPGLDQIAFEKGLLESAQTTVGAELALGAGWTVDVQTYFNWMDPILYDVQINPNVDEVLNPAPTAPPGIAPAVLPEDTDGLNDRLDRLLAPATGRSYGAELLLRRQSDSGITGWLSYTFSRSERLRDDRWISFDFDRTHLLNLVASFPLPRSWQLGVRAQVQSGRPLTTTSGLAEARTATFVRFDLRIDKTAIWNDWLLDFYIDISNAILGGEELAPENTLRYVIPTVGFRGLF
jgi:hypothetical protein